MRSSTGASARANPVALHAGSIYHSIPELSEGLACPVDMHEARVRGPFGVWSR